MTYKRPEYKTGSFYERKEQLIEEFESVEIRHALFLSNLDMRKAAKELDLSYFSFYTLIKKHGMKTRNGKVTK